MNYCPSCQTQVNDSMDVCPSCGYKLIPSNENHSPTIVRPATRPKIQCEVEIAWLHDRTGSGEKWKEGATKTAKNIGDQVGVKARSQKWYVISHGDEDFKEIPILHTDGGTLEQAIKDIDMIVQNGGGDPKETHLSAIENALDTIPWTCDPTRARGAIIAYINADTKPAKSGHTATEIGKRIKDMGLLLYLICEPTPTLQELVDAAEGLMFQITNNPDPAELQKIAMQLSASIVASVASGSTVPMTIKSK